ncbi:MAG TPA: DUF4893 domain-containing protein [Sphingomicrobium sp.]
MRSAFLLSIALALAGCSTTPHSPMIPMATTNWREIVSGPDRERLRDWRTAFTGALGAATRAGHAADIAREGPLLQPDAALGGPIPNGFYRCRVIKLGAKSQGMLDWVAYPPFTCQVSQARQLQKLAKLSGSQRQVGLIFPNDTVRQVFLGTLVLGDERRALQYGEDETRNVAGYVERIGPNRWRLVMPRPHFESQLDVMELVPLQSGAR